MRNGITLRQLEIFLAVARDGQVTRAAQALHLTQSATSMALTQLERGLQTLLFERTGRSLTLTERGRLLLAEAPDLLTRASELPALLGGRGSELRGELRVAASTTVGRYLLAPRVAAFAAVHPLLVVRLDIVNTEAAATALSRHEVDVAYVEGTVARADLVAQLWRTDTLEIVASARHWRGRPRRLTPEQLAGSNWVMREPGSGTREVFEQALRVAKLGPPREWLTLNDSEAVAQVVAAGSGVACLPRLVVDSALQGKRLVALQAPFLTLERPLWELRRRTAVPGPVQSAFKEFLS